MVETNDLASTGGHDQAVGSRDDAADFGAEGLHRTTIAAATITRAAKYPDAACRVPDKDGTIGCTGDRRTAVVYRFLYMFKGLSIKGYTVTAQCGTSQSCEHCASLTGQTD